MYTPDQFHIASNAQSFSLIKWDRNLFVQKTWTWLQNCPTHGEISAVMIFLSFHHINKQLVSNIKQQLTIFTRYYCKQNQSYFKIEELV